MSTITSLKLPTGPVGPRPKLIPSGAAKMSPQLDGLFVSRDHVLEYKWKPNLAETQQSVASQTLGGITRDDLAVDPGKLNSLPSGSWVVLQQQNSGLNEFRLMQFADPAAQAQYGSNSLATLDATAFRAKLASPDGEHFSATQARGGYSSELFHTTQDKAFRVSEQQAQALLQVAQTGAPALHGHIGRDTVTRQLSLAQKIGAAIIGPFAIISLFR